MIITVTPNPAVDHMLYVDGLRLHDSNRVSQVEHDAGGKGINASRVIHNLGGKTLATGFLGGGTGAYVRHVLADEGVPHHFIQTVGETRINFSLEDGSGLPPTCFNEPGPSITGPEIEDLMSFLAGHLHPGAWLLIAGSLPPGVSPDVFFLLGRLARDLSAHFVVDADGEGLRLGLESGPALLKPNVKEAERLLGKPLVTQEDLIRAALEIRARALNSQPDCSPAVVISRGEAGAVMAEESGVWIGETPRIELRSSVGSGDSMVGAMLHALDLGQSPSQALALGMAAGAATAATTGAGLATEAEVMSLLPSAVVLRA